MSQLTTIEAPQLASLTGIRHTYFTRQGGTSSGIYESLNAGLGSGDIRDDVKENRNRMAAHLGCAADKMASPYQVHSNLAIVTDKSWDADRPQVDAVVTATPGLAVGIVTADCGPVLFADPVNRVVGAAHAGWKGALTGVLESTIEAMESCGATRENIVAVLGPSISQQNYEVGPEFPTPFLEENAGNTQFFSPSTKDKHHMFDLSAYIVKRLENAGVNAAALGRCTYGEANLFYSYRRTTHMNEPDYGRQLSAITLFEETN